MYLAVMLRRISPVVSVVRVDTMKIKYLSILIALFLFLTGCSNAASDANGNDTANSSAWDKLHWDKGKWD